LRKNEGNVRELREKKEFTVRNVRETSANNESSSCIRVSR